MIFRLLSQLTSLSEAMNCLVYAPPEFMQGVKIFPITNQISYLVRLITSISLKIYQHSSKSNFFSISRRRFFTGLSETAISRFHSKIEVTD